MKRKENVKKMRTLVIYSYYVYLLINSMIDLYTDLQFVCWMSTIRLRFRN